MDMSIVFVVVIVMVVILSLLIQRKGLARQKQTVDIHQGEIERYKKVMTRGGESLRLSRKMVENQNKIIALLSKSETERHHNKAIQATLNSTAELSG